MTNSEVPQGLFLDVRFKSVLRTAEVHRYRLVVTYTNTLKEAQDGWKLKVCFPAFLTLNSEFYVRSETRIGGEPYVQLESSSKDRIYSGESLELVPLNSRFIEYEINDNVYRRRLREQHKVTWQFYTPNAPVIVGERPLEELHEF